MDGTLLDERGEVDLPRLERLWTTWIKRIPLSWPFRDRETDIEMPEMAGHSYAVWPCRRSCQAVAKHLAPTHQEGGVYQVIEGVSRIDPPGNKWKGRIRWRYNC